MVGQLLHKAAIAAFIQGNHAEARRIAGLGEDFHAEIAAVVRQARYDAERCASRRLPPREAYSKRYLKIPLNALPGAPWNE